MHIYVTTSEEGAKATAALKKKSQLCFSAARKYILSDD